MSDPVNSPKHYTSHPSGIECIELTEHLGFCLGNAVKYLYRCDSKNAPIEDLRKAAWYVRRQSEGILLRRIAPSWPFYDLSDFAAIACSFLDNEPRGNIFNALQRILLANTRPELDEAVGWIEKEISEREARA